MKFYYINIKLSSIHLQFYSLIPVFLIISTFSFMFFNPLIKSKLKYPIQNIITQSNKLIIYMKKQQQNILQLLS